MTAPAPWPTSPRAWPSSPTTPGSALGASLALEAGDPGAALAECDRASSASAPVSAGREALRARALMALGRPEAALDAWSRALGDDPEDARSLLGRARAFTQLGLWDQALADLERAADDAGERPGLLGRIALAYGSCLIARPARIDRVLALARRGGRMAPGDPIRHAWGLSRQPWRVIEPGRSCSIRDFRFEISVVSHGR